MPNIQLKLFALVFLFGSTVQAGADAEWKPVEITRTAYGNQEVHWVFEKSTDRKKGPVRWELFHGNRRLASGLAQQEKRRFLIEFEAPSIKDQVRLKTEVRLSGGESYPLTLFGKPSFDQLRPRIQQQGMAVYDPEGAFTSLLQKENIPLEKIQQPAGLRNISGKIFLVAPGVRLSESPALVQTILRIVEEGRIVIILSLEPGEIELNDTDASELSLYHGKQWNTLSEDFREDLSLKSGFHLCRENGHTILRIVPEKAPWHVLHLVWEKPGGDLYILQYSFLEDWERTPAAAYGLEEILDHILPSDNDDMK